jgi:hypothetical protein
LVEIVKNRVREQFGVELTPEVFFLSWEIYVYISRNRWPTIIWKCAGWWRQKCFI